MDVKAENQNIKSADTASWRVMFNDWLVCGLILLNQSAVSNRKITLAKLTCASGSQNRKAIECYWQTLVFIWMSCHHEYFTECFKFMENLEFILHFYFVLKNEKC